VSPLLPVSCELQEKLLSVAAMGDMPDLTIAKGSVGSWRGSLIRRFDAQNINLTIKSGPLEYQSLNTSCTYGGPTPLLGVG
jgi:hypothetical protein